MCSVKCTSVVNQNGVAEHGFSVSPEKMRIYYFPNYIRQHELQPCMLKNCSVVIDGQNFLYNMYEDSKLPFVFGCESDKFATHLKRRLKMFKDANVKCYFVFKGGDLNIERKKTKLEDKNEGEKFDFVVNNKLVPPVLMNEVYKQVLDEMRIPYAVCEFESKQDCVALAEKLQCPVISIDIEFCFMKAPYIPYDTLRYDTKMKAIGCNQYRRKDFLKRHSLTEQKLAIFAVLTDTNIFPADFFINVFKSVGAASQKAYGERYAVLWLWLSRRQETAALEIIYKFINQTDKDKFAVEMYSVMDFMQTKRESIVADYLLNDGTLDFKLKDPNLFEKGVVSKRIAIPYINLYSYNYLFNQGAVESRNSKRSLLLSMDIVKYAYNLLTDFKRDEFKFVVGREGVKIGAKREAPDEIRTPVFASGWKDIKKMRLFENFLKENSMDEALISQVPRDAAMLIIALVYFARKKSSDNISVDREVYSVITCFVMLAGSRDVATNDRAEADKATRDYFKVSTGEMMRIFDRELLHNLVEFQQCLQQLNYLNILCGSPYEPTVYHRTYNGTFVYKLFHDMVHSSHDCDTYINNLFNCSPSVLDYIKKLVGLYKEIL